MQRIPSWKRLLLAGLVLTFGFPGLSLQAKDRKWIQSTAYLVPPETAPDGEGYFAIIEGHNRKLYIGTHANADNSWLVEFDPASETMKVAVDTHAAIGHDIKGFGAQAKIHTRNNVWRSGKIYFGTKQGYPNATETREDYPGGYPMAYDPQTDKTKVYPIPIPHQGINTITPDESRGLAYVGTCSDHRPGPEENSVFLVLDLKTGTYRELIDTHHVYGFIVVDWLGRAYHPLVGGDIARYNPDEKKLDRLHQTIDGQPPTAESHLADPGGHPINWDITPDRRTLYSQPMATNYLYEYDLTAEGDTVPGRNVGTVIPGGTGTDCRAMCVGPTGTVWCAITENKDGGNRLHLVSYRAGDKAPTDHGLVAVAERKPDFTGPGFDELDGHGTTKRVILGVCEGRDGYVNILALQPYTVLRVSPDQLR